MARGSSQSFLSTRRGRLTLALVCLASFLDFVDTTVVNVALPTIRHHLAFSVQSLQWVVSGYVLTYGGFLMLGGRAGDLIGRRRLLIAGTSVFAVASLTAALAHSMGVLIAARLLQGTGAAMTAPAALSILMTSYTEGSDPQKAIGIWSAMVPVSSTVGVLAGGALTQGPGWRWVFIVNLPVCVLVLLSAVRLLPDDRRKASLRDFDFAGALLVTAGMLLLVYALVKAPDVGWGATPTIVELAGAVGFLVAFVVTEQVQRNPVIPFSIFRLPGLAAADATQVVAYAGFLSEFFFLTLYMQNVLHFSPLGAGAAYLCVTVAVLTVTAMSVKLLPRIGTRPIAIFGCLAGAIGVFLLAQIPVHGSYWSDILPGLVISGVGVGGIIFSVTTAANTGVPPDKAGLAAALMNTSGQLGSGLGIAAFSAVATAHTRNLLAAHVAPAAALTSGFQRGFLVAAALLAAAAVIATRATNTRGAPAPNADVRAPVLDTA
jgi:EmrB/QacA subfamily drug resistance transporter